MQSRPQMPPRWAGRSPCSVLPFPNRHSPALKPEDKEAWRGMGDDFSGPELRRGGQEVDKQTDAVMTEPLLWTHSSRPSGHHVASSHDQHNL